MKVVVRWASSSRTFPGNLLPGDAEADFIPCDVEDGDVDATDLEDVPGFQLVELHGHPSV